MKKSFILLIFVVLLSACSANKEVTLNYNRDLILALGGNSYATLSDAERYRAAEYLFRKGDFENARAFYEDILTYNPSVVALKYRLAQIYRTMDSVRFSEKNEKGQTTYYKRQGKELSVAVMAEIYDHDPWFYPIHGELMLEEIQNKNAEKAKALYDSAQVINKFFAISDYRTAFVTLGQEDNTNRFEEAASLLKSGRQTYSDLYDAYKNLGNIFSVQNKDTASYTQLSKAVLTRSEAVDLFDAYAQLAHVCEKLYFEKNEERYKDEAMLNAAISMQYFPGYLPAAKVISKLQLLNITQDSANPDSNYALVEAAMSHVADLDIPVKDRIKFGSGYTPIIPKSILREELKTQKISSEPKKDRSLMIAGGIGAGAGVIFIVLAILGNGEKADKPTPGNGFGNPPGFPTPP